MNGWIAYCHECRWNKDAYSRVHALDLANLHAMVTDHEKVVLFPPKKS